MARKSRARSPATSWTLDPRNRTLRTEIDLPNPHGLLRPGLYAYAIVTVDEHQNALCVPSTALVRQDARVFCVAVVDGLCVRRTVKPGWDDETNAEILSGLKGDDLIVKAFATSLTDGQLVTLPDRKSAR